LSRDLTYDEIFQALAVEQDVLLPKPLLNLGFDGVVRWKSPASEVLFSLPNMWNSGLHGGWGGVQKWLWEQDVSFCRQGLENVIVRYDKCLNKLGNYVEV
jgi:hypothetical protein